MKIAKALKVSSKPATSTPTNGPLRSRARSNMACEVRCSMARNATSSTTLAANMNQLSPLDQPFSLARISP